MKVNWPRVVDFAERVSATFAQAFLGVVLISGLSTLTSIEAASIAGGIAAAKYLYVQVNAYLASE